MDRCFTCWVDLAQLIFVGSDLELGEGHGHPLSMHKNIDLMSLCVGRGLGLLGSQPQGSLFPQESHSATHRAGAVSLSHLFLVSHFMNEETETHVLSTLPKIAQLVTR